MSTARALFFQSNVEGNSRVMTYNRNVIVNLMAKLLKDRGRQYNFRIGSCKGTTIGT